MKVFRSKVVIAAVVAISVIVLWQLFRINRSSQAAEILGFLDNYNYAADTTFNKYNAEDWDGYQTGSGVPPGK